MVGEHEPAVPMGQGHSQVAVDLTQRNALYGYALYNPIATQALFWRPRYIVSSPMVDQIPYLFWLVDVIRPRSITQIGLGDGLVYMALCQAVERTGSSTSVLGVDQATPGLQPDPEGENFRTKHDAEYGDFSRITQETVSDLVAHGHEELDLLVLNASLDDLDVEACAQACFERLSDRAVILVCQPEIVLKQDPGWGGRLSRSGRRSVMGPLAPGRGKLAVVLQGEHQPERLLALGGGTVDSPVRMVARQVFGRLGQGLQDALTLDELGQSRELERREQRQVQQEAHILRAALSDAEAGIAAAETAKTVALQQLVTATTAHSVVIGQLAAIRAEKVAIEAECAALRAARRTEPQVGSVDKAPALQERADRAGGPDRAALTGQLQTQLAAAEKALGAAREEIVGLKQRHAQRVDDIAALTQDFNTTLGAQKKRIAELDRSLTKMLDARRQADEAHQQLTEQLVALRSSISWRITRPLRQAKLLLSGGKKRKDQ